MRRKPKRRFSGIEPVWSGGRWKWRARLKRNGVATTGQVFETQEQAHADRANLEEFKPTTLGEALDAVIADAQRRGIKPESVDGVYLHPANAILGEFEADDPLFAFSTDDVEHAIENWRDDGLAPGTIRAYLQCWHKAFVLAKVDSPIPEAREQAKEKLVVPEPDMPWFTPKEVGRIVELIRTYEPPTHETDGELIDPPLRGVRPQVRQRDADLVMIIACTGIRHGEFSRVVAGDFDLERATLRVRFPKVKKRTRTQALPAVAVDAARRLVEGLEPDEHVTTEHRLNHLFGRWNAKLSDTRLPEERRLPQGRRINARAFRRSNGTGLLLNGATLADVRRQLGHAQQSMETLRYLEAVEAHRMDQVTRFAEDAFGSAPPSGDAEEPSGGEHTGQRSSGFRSRIRFGRSSQVLKGTCHPTIEPDVKVGLAIARAVGVPQLIISRKVAGLSAPPDLRSP